MSCRLAASAACRLLAIAAATAATPPRTSALQLPWYVTASAIHRVTLKPTTEFWRFEHLSMDPAEAERQKMLFDGERPHATRSCSIGATMQMRCLRPRATASSSSGPICPAISLRKMSSGSGVTARTLTTGRDGRAGMPRGIRSTCRSTTGARMRGPMKRPASCAFG